MPSCVESLDRGALANRRRRQVEIPPGAGEAFDLLDAAIRELPRVEQVARCDEGLHRRVLTPSSCPVADRGAS